MFGARLPWHQTIPNHRSFTRLADDYVDDDGDLQTATRGSDDVNYTVTRSGTERGRRRFISNGGRFYLFSGIDYRRQSVDSLSIFKSLLKNFISGEKFYTLK